MNELIWDGEMDCGWEDLASKVKSESQRFTDEMLKTVAFSPSEEAKKLISQESMERFCLLAEKLAGQLEDGYYCQFEDVEDNVHNASKLTNWIILGSLTETALQIFLAFYIEYYKKSQWQQWINFPEVKVKEEVNGAITKLIERQPCIKHDKKNSGANAIRNLQHKKVLCCVLNAAQGFFTSGGFGWHI